MKIAIVTSHPVPFALGGAENLWWGLQSHIQHETPHDCDIIALPCPETTLKGLIGSYEAFFRLDLSAYDCVITGKYPAWMVQHPNHVCYMLHRLRGLYDTYRGPVFSESSPRLPLVRGFLQWMRNTTEEGGSDSQVLEEFFQRFNALKAAGLPEDTFAFPGPFAREMIHFLDNAALSPDRIRRHAAISATVAQRPGYFDPETVVTVLHPPPHRSDYRCGNDDYLFVSSRLDGPKRVGLVIEAMRHVDEDIPLLIAGTGPAEAELRMMAGNDPRIRFLGFVADDDMPDLYANALAVPFVPLDEDYGLVAVEAMRSGKPVLTCVDSGGPCELVEDGINGFVCAPEPEALAEKIGLLCRHREVTRDMGKEAFKSAEIINWANVLQGLLERPGAKTSPSRRSRKRKLTVATTFPVWPPMGGGQARVFHLYRHLAKHYDIDIVSLVGQPQEDREIAPGLFEIPVAKSTTHLEYERELAAAVGNLPIGDIAAHFLSDLTPDFLDALEISSLGSAAVIACHPYLVDQIRNAAPGKPLWYEAQDVEFELKRTLLASHQNGGPLLEAVRKVERLSWQTSRHVFACAERDLVALEHNYGPTRACLHEVPNGVALDEICFVAPDRRAKLKTEAGLEGRTLALFMGSWHGPNLEAIEQILAAAPQLPKMDFVIIGSACRPFADRTVPPNVKMLGQVDAEVRDVLLAVADVALNPMLSGSGTNLKMLDYFAAGIPVISSQFGARGLKVEPGKHFILAENDWTATLQAFVLQEREELDSLATKARQLVEERYSWETIADNFADALGRSDFQT
jgi:glycosyltransferase involved in cell wall biosynthesis